MVGVFEVKELKICLKSVTRAINHVNQKNHTWLISLAKDPQAFCSLMTRTTQILVVLVTQTSFCEGSSGDLAKRRLFSQAKLFVV